MLLSHHDDLHDAGEVWGLHNAGNATRKAPGACAGTAGWRGAVTAIRWYGAPSGGRGSGSPLFGHSAIARSACAVIVSDGLAPRLADTAAPSATCSPSCPNTRW